MATIKSIAAAVQVRLSGTPAVTALVDASLIVHGWVKTTEPNSLPSISIFKVHSDRVGDNRLSTLSEGEVQLTISATTLSQANDIAEAVDLALADMWSDADYSYSAVDDLTLEQPGDGISGVVLTYTVSRQQ